jgi:hypothetical protein
LPLTPERVGAGGGHEGGGPQRGRVDDDAAAGPDSAGLAGFGAGTGRRPGVQGVENFEAIHITGRLRISRG